MRRPLRLPIAFCVISALVIGLNCKRKEEDAPSLPEPPSPVAESAPSVEIVMPSTRAEYIVIEAENGRIIPPVQKVSIEGASGGLCVEAPELSAEKEENIGGGVSLSFKVNHEGEYYVWARVFWQHSCANSLTISAEASQPLDLTSGTYAEWHWLQLQKAPGEPAQFKLAPGRHSVSIGNREDGSRIDQLLLTNDEKYVPVGIEKPRGVK